MIAERDKFFSIIAHDLKSPISGFLTLTKFISEQAITLSNVEIKEITQEMHKSSEHLSALLNNLLHWARLSQGVIDFYPEECSLNALIKNSINQVRAVANLKDISLKFDADEDLLVIADQAMIHAVLRNLITNAVKFTPQNGDIKVNVRQKESEIEVSVQDNGVGMDSKTASTVFALGTKKSNTGTDGEKGTGLGLILCKEFIEKHNGRIWTESEPGKGTKVFFTLSKFI